MATALLSVLTHLFGSGDLGLREAWFRIIAAVVAVVPMFAVIWLARLSAPKSPRAEVGYMLVAYLIAAGARGVALASLLALNPEIEDGGLLFRLPTSLISMSLTVAIFTFAVASYESQRDNIARLRLENDQLRETLIELETNSRAKDRSEIRAVSQRIVDELHRIELYPAKEQIAEIQKLVDGQVRPLSKNFAAGIQQWLPQQGVSPKLRFREISMGLQPVSRFPSFWFLLPLALAPAPATIADYGWLEGIEISIYSLLALLASLVLVSRLWARVQAGLRGPWRELIYTALLLVVAAAGSAAGYLALLNTPRPTTYVLIGLIAFPIYSWVITLGSSLLAALKATTDQLTKIEAELRWAIARVNLLSWYNRGVVARLLHGPIQNSMHVTIIKLQSAGALGEVDQVIHELAQRVQEAQSASENDSRGRPEIVELLTESEALWAEIAQVSLEFDELVSFALASDGAAGGIVLDLCNEQFSNAIRHGKATHVRIALSLEGAKLIKILVEHNGSAQAQLTTPPPGNPPPGTEGLALTGLGTKFLATCSVRLESAVVDNLSRTEIYLPLAS
jgi:signal transduction histidine kinase